MIYRLGLISKRSTPKNKTCWKSENGHLVNKENNFHQTLKSWKTSHAKRTCRLFKQSGDAKEHLTVIGTKSKTVGHGAKREEQRDCSLMLVDEN